MRTVTFIGGQHLIDTGTSTVFNVLTVPPTWAKNALVVASCMPPSGPGGVTGTGTAQVMLSGAYRIPVVAPTIAESTTGTSSANEVQTITINTPLGCAGGPSWTSTVFDGAGPQSVGVFGNFDITWQPPGTSSTYTAANIPITADAGIVSRLFEAAGLPTAGDIKVTKTVGTNSIYTITFTGNYGLANVNAVTVNATRLYAYLGDNLNITATVFSGNKVNPATFTFGDSVSTVCIAIGPGVTGIADATGIINAELPEGLAIKFTPGKAGVAGKYANNCNVIWNG